MSHDQAQIKELKRQNAQLRAALKEVMGWIDNWDPEFTDDDEWEETQERVDEALEGGEET